MQSKRLSACSAGAETIVYDRGLLLLAGLVQEKNTVLARNLRSFTTERRGRVWNTSNFRVEARLSGECRIGLQQEPTLVRNISCQRLTETVGEMFLGHIRHREDIRWSSQLIAGMLS